jgi:hypothetical protein
MMQSYLRDGVPHKQLVSMQSIYRHFREASMDFADLWSVDFWAHLRCECVDSTATIMADGITISCLNSSLHLLGPWLPKQPSAGEALVPSQRGSDYAQRFAIEQRHLRVYLRQLSHRGGMPAAELDDAVQAFEQHQMGDVGHLLQELSILVDGQALVSPWVQGLLRELGAHTPATGIVRRQGAELLGRWVDCMHGILRSPPSARAQAAGAWTDDLDGMMRRDLPALHSATSELLRRAVLQPGSWDDSHTKTILGLVQSLLLVRLQHPIPSIRLKAISMCIDSFAHVHCWSSVCASQVTKGFSRYCI